MSAALPYAIAAAPLILAAILLTLEHHKNKRADRQLARLQAKVATAAREGGTLRHGTATYPLEPEANVEIKHRAAGGISGRPSEIPKPHGPRGWGGL